MVRSGSKKGRSQFSRLVYGKGDNRCTVAVQSSDVELAGLTIRGPSSDVEGLIRVVRVMRGSFNFSLGGGEKT